MKIRLFVPAVYLHGITSRVRNENHDKISTGSVTPQSHNFDVLVLADWKVTMPMITGYFGVIHNC